MDDGWWRERLDTGDARVYVCVVPPEVLPSFDNHGSIADAKVVVMLAFRRRKVGALGDFYLQTAAFNGPVEGERWRGRHIPAPYNPPYITATPDTKATPRHERDDFIVLACDGVWDAMTSEEVVAFVAADKGDRPGVASRLVSEVLRREVEACGMGVVELMSLPPGRQRRTRHDGHNGHHRILRRQVRVNSVGWRWLVRRIVWWRQRQ